MEPVMLFIFIPMIIGVLGIIFIGYKGGFNFFKPLPTPPQPPPIAGFTKGQDLLPFKVERWYGKCPKVRVSRGTIAKTVASKPKKRKPKKKVTK